jgi:glycosyltransferase involved in cell wall biosynthesis
VGRKSTVTAIISTYNAAKWLQGRIDNLLEQTLYARGRLEIVVVNAGSEQHERKILRQYLRDGVPLRIITSLREPIYVSWNRGIRLAAGQLITNANTDDRLRPDALEVMANKLDAQPETGLVYADSHVTDTVNATWERFNRCHAPPYTSGVLEWNEYDARLLARFCFMGSCPMWRKSLHEKHGYFDESYQLAGDYEMWLRLAANGVQMQHIPEKLSLFYFGGSTIQHQAASDLEARRALLKWRRYIA